MRFVEGIRNTKPGQQVWWLVVYERQVVLLRKREYLDQFKYSEREFFCGYTFKEKLKKFAIISHNECVQSKGMTFDTS
jgi:hypothetical protein